MAQDPAGPTPHPHSHPQTRLPPQASALALIRCYLQPSKHLRGTLGDHWSHYHEK